MSAFYRLFLGHAMRRMGQLVPPTPPRGAMPALWIQRGKGHGGGYQAKVGRRCLNEAEVLREVAAALPTLSVRAVELADLPFVEQLPLFRAAAVLTGMHGAGYANLIFLPPGAVVAELCPLGYCTQSFERLSARLGLTYLRWTNSIAANAKAGYDTIVDPAQFVGLMRRALAEVRVPTLPVRSEV